MMCVCVVVVGGGCSDGGRGVHTVLVRAGCCVWGLMLGLCAVYVLPVCKASALCFVAWGWIAAWMHGELERCAGQLQVLLPAQSSVGSENPVWKAGSSRW